MQRFPRGHALCFSKPENATDGKHHICDPIRNDDVIYVAQVFVQTIDYLDADGTDLDCHGFGKFRRFTEYRTRMSHIVHHFCLTRKNERSLRRG